MSTRSHRANSRPRNSRSRLLAGLAVATGMLVLGACGELPRGVEVGQLVPEYSATNLEGDSVHLADLRDEVVLLNVWATWCAPCREEIPQLQRLHEENAGRGLRIVGVSVDPQYDRNNIGPFLEGYGVSYTIWHDPSDRISTRFRVIGVPTTLMIDREGTIVWRHLGPVRTDDPALRSALETALAEET